MDFYHLGSYLSGLTGSSGLYGGYLPGMLPGSMTASAEMAPVYAKFADALQKTLGERQTFGQGGDVVLSFPPKSTEDCRVDENCSPADMSSEEYKKYICGKISSLPVSGSCRANCSGVLVLKKEALVSMQKDPAYEKEVLSGLGKEFQAQYSCYAPKFGCRIIGGSAGEWFGAGMTAVSGSGGSGVRESPWEGQREQADVRTQTQLPRGGSLADRLASNRASRLQQRMTQRQEGTL